jgi:uncharacterized protein YndB with AHSA1/START domain
VAVNEIDIPAPPEAVWDVLVDPYTYVRWVVGGRAVRGVDADWPQPGSAFHHIAGRWPVEVRDSTKVAALDPPRRLVLEARARPVGVARVALTLDPNPDGSTHLTIDEEPISGPVRLVPRFLLDLMTKARNAESLRRLRNLVEDRSRARR